MPSPRAQEASDIESFPVARPLDDSPAAGAAQRLHHRCRPMPSLSRGSRPIGHRGMYGQGTYFASQLSTTARLLDSVVKRTKSLKRRTWITCCRQMHGQHIGHRASSRPCASLCHKPYCLFCHGQHDGHAHRASPWLSHVRLVRAFHGRRPPVRERLVDVPPVTCQHFCKTKNQNEYISLTITTHRQQ